MCARCDEAVSAGLTVAWGLDQGLGTGGWGLGTQTKDQGLNPCSRSNHAVYRHDDHAVTDEVAVAIGRLNASGVDELAPVADPGRLARRSR